MIKYEDIVKRILFIEKRKTKNQEKIKFLTEENNTLSSNLKLLNQKKEMLEKMNQDLADLIPDKKKTADNQCLQLQQATSLDIQRQVFREHP